MIKFSKLGVIHEENPSGFKLGSVQSPIVIPDTYLLDDSPFFSLTALMQFLSPKCGGYSLAQAVNFAKVLNNASSTNLSGNFDYAYEKTVDGASTEDGTTITAVGLAGSTVGSCQIDLFPQDTETTVDATPFSEASEEAKADGLTRLLGTPFLLDDLSIEGIRQACYQNGFVILEVEVGKEWWTLSDGTESWDSAVGCPIVPPESVIDSHFILVAPYDIPNDRLWFINSWSEEWAKNGFGYLQSNYASFIKNGIAFKKIPLSVQQALTNNQVSLAQQILIDLKEVVELIKKEL